MRVVIIGAGNGYEMIRHFADKQTKMWAVSSIYPILRSYDVEKVFEIHKPEKWKAFDYQKLGSKLVLPYRLEIVSDAEYRPLTNLEPKYGVLFSSTISWMVAEAIETPEVTEIVILGVDMEWKSEYEKQRDGLFFLLGFARALGKKVTIPESSEINIFGKRYGHDA